MITKACGTRTSPHLDLSSLSVTARSAGLPLSVGRATDGQAGGVSGKTHSHAWLAPGTGMHRFPYLPRARLRALRLADVRRSLARLVGAGPAPEPARLVDLVFTTCPAERAGQLEARVRAAFGVSPPAAAVQEVLPAGAGRVDGLAEPLASWLRVWDWSPVVLAGMLADWESVRRLSPTGPPDPRIAPVLVPVKEYTALNAGDLAETAAALAAATV